MWQCKHCLKDFDYSRATEKANHSRHCDLNPKKLDTYKNIRKSHQMRLNKTLGVEKDFSVRCDCCNSTFIVKERENQFPLREKYFCSRSCANNRQSWWDSDDNGFKSRSYRAIAKKHHELRCVICGFDKIVAIHHIDENKLNNDPTNLIPLCPNHHEMCHSRWKYEVEPYIKNWQSQFICS